MTTAPELTPGAALATMVALTLLGVAVTCLLCWAAGVAARGPGRER